MSYTFRMIFSGLCAFVPNKPILESPDYVNVVLVNADAQRGTFLDADADAHFPLLLFSLADLGVDGGAGGAMGFWLLANEQLSIDVVADSSTELETRHRSALQVHATPTRSSRPTDGGEADFRWVPAMSNILGSAADINPECLADVPLDRLVVARVRIEDGLLKSHALANLGGEPVVAQFVPAPSASASPCKQALAHRAAVEIEVEEGFSVVITARNFKDSTQVRTLKLRQPTTPAPGDDAPGDVEVHISNLCCGYFLTEAGIGAPPNTLPEPDDDFRAFYALAATPPKPPYEFLPVPVPVEYTKPVKDGGGEPVRCTLVQLNSHG